MPRLIGPPLLQADSGPNLIKEGKMSKDDQVARYLSWQIAGIISEEALGSSPGQVLFFLLCDIWWFSVGSRLGQQAPGGACLIVPSRFRDESY